jgi:hypothetical protein
MTMFHALPPSAESEVRRHLAEAVKQPRAGARIDGLMDLGGGVAFRVVSLDLDRIRGELAQSFHGLLGSQDIGGWRPHITIQNKVTPKLARMLIARLQRGFMPRPILIRGLGLYRYLDGPWERVAIYAFRG